jgi:hypothetical protein
MDKLTFAPRTIEKGHVNWSSMCDRDNSFDKCQLFMAYFNSVPNLILLDENINCKKANQWFLENFRLQVTDFHYVKRQNKPRAKPEYDDLYYIMYDDLLVYFNTNESEVSLLFRKTDENLVDALLTGLLKFSYRSRVRRKPEIRLISNGYSGLETFPMSIATPKFTLKDNYNDDLIPVHETIIKRLSQKNDKGLILLHGKPGTGKTSYIRYLIQKTRKNIIFLPPNMATAITDAGLMPLLLRNPNSIFVIEDAEQILIDRNKHGNSAVSALLNLADGLLSDCLNIQIICSFNTDLSHVDSALLRKGRLIAKYEFKELSVDKAQALSNTLGFSSVIESPMTLSAIYNQSENEYQYSNRKHTIGFKTVSRQAAQ